VELYHYSPNKPSWRGVQLEKNRDNFTLMGMLLCNKGITLAVKTEESINDNGVYNTKSSLV